MTELSGVHAKFTGDANGLSAAAQTAQKGIEKVQSAAEASAKVFERAFSRSEKSVDQLRRAIDPVYAASKRYEAAVETLDKALKMGTISQAAHARMVEQANAAYLRSQSSVSAMGQRLGFLGNVSEQTRGKIQQVGFQVQDFAVQVGAGTSATQAFAQQFPQLAGAFGPVGVAVGTLAAVGIPLLAAAFANMSAESDAAAESLKRQQEVMQSLTAATTQLALERQMLFSGAQFTEEQEALNEVKRLTEERAKAQAELNNLVTIGGRALAFQDEAKAKREALQAEIAGIDAKLEALNKQRELKASAEEFKGAVELALSVQQAIASTDISGPWRNVLSSIQTAIGKAREFAAVSQMKAIGGGRGAGPGGPLVGSADLAELQAGGGVIRPMPPVSPTRGGGGGGGGGGGSNPIQTEIESLRQSLLTKEEVELESYARRQEALKAALDQRLITEEEFRRMSEEAQQQHADKMTSIDAYRYGSGLQKAGAFFGDMASAMQGGNEKMLAISKKFGAAQALISAWQGAAEALKLPFPSNLAAFAKVLATGMSAVNAISGTSGGGGSRGRGRGSAVSAAPAASAAPAQQTTQNLGITFVNDPFGIGERTARAIAARVNEAQRNGSRLIVSVGT